MKAMNKNKLRLLPKHKELLKELFKKYMPETEVWVYGSRVQGKSHSASDLDLALRSPDLSKIDSSKLNLLQSALRESSLPFLVEVRDWAELPRSFHREIELNRIILIPAKGLKQSVPKES